MPLARLSSRPLSVGWVVLALAGCSSTPTKAPVEDRKPPRAQAAAPTSASAAAAAARPASGAPAAAATPDGTKPLPGAENAGKPGYYTVRPGDTMIRIGLDNGQNWRDIVRWNAIENPNLIEVGQVLRVVPPGADPTAVASRGVAPPQVEARALEARPASSAPASAPASASAGAASTPASAPAKPAAPLDDEPAWAWPAAGAVVSGFDEPRNKGLDIAGKAGDPVLAAADGRVMWSGPHRGYGNLVIVKHNNTYLTAYGHNQTLLVKEDQTVRRGQKIAEMGATDAERVQLHFEIRRLGKPVDPARLLPAR